MGRATKSKLCRLAAIAGIALFGLYQNALAAVLYDNGPISGTVDARLIKDGYAVSNSFTLSTSSILTGVNFGAWWIPDDPVISVDWSITTDYATYPAGATASVTTDIVLIPLNFAGYTVSQNSFSLPNIGLAAGTYYLVLQNAVADNDHAIAWDTNFGLSTATQNGIPYASESFQILGTTGEIPLPAALPLFATGLGALGLLSWRRKRKRAT